MSKSHSITVTPIKQAIENLRGIEDSLRDCFGYGPTVGVHVERMARILATALTDLDARLAKLEQYQEDIDWIETALGVHEEDEMEARNG